MLTQETLEKLRHLRLGTMGTIAEALQAPLKDPEYQTLSFEERFGLLVDRQWTARWARLLKELELVKADGSFTNFLGPLAR